MDQESNLPEWKITDKLPEAFVVWLGKTLVEKFMAPLVNERKAPLRCNW